MPACITPPAHAGRRCASSGNRLLYDFCETHGVPHRRCGKFIVATNEAERTRIEAIHAQGKINGVEGLELIGGNAARDLEPELSCVAALVSPATGIIDGHAYMLALQGDLEAHGGAIAFETPVERMTPMLNGWRVRFGGARSRAYLDVDAVINCAGLSAQQSRAASRAIRQRASRNRCWRRAITSPMRGSRHSRG